MHLLQRAARRPTLVLGAVAVLVVAGALAYPILAPKASTTLDQAAPASAMSLAVGTFMDGAPGHPAKGTVRLLQSSDGPVLRFEGYEATAGPDVYFFLTEKAQPRTTEDVESGFRVLVPGGAADGQATLRGNFNVPLPAGFDAARYQGLAAWCDDFNVLFGWATLA